MCKGVHPIFVLMSSVGKRTVGAASKTFESFGNLYKILSSALPKIKLIKLVLLLIVTLIASESIKVVSFQLPSFLRTCHAEIEHPEGSPQLGAVHVPQLDGERFYHADLESQWPNALERILEPLLA